MKKIAVQSKKINYRSYSEWVKKADVGEIYSGEDHGTVVKLPNPESEPEEYPVQIYGDGYGHFYYGVDHDGSGMYYLNGEWLPYDEIEDSPFPDFIYED